HKRRIFSGLIMTVNAIKYFAKISAKIIANISLIVKTPKKVIKVMTILSTGTLTALLAITLSAQERSFNLSKTAVSASSLSNIAKKEAIIKRIGIPKVILKIVLIIRANVMPNSANRKP